MSWFLNPAVEPSRVIVTIMGECVGNVQMQVNQENKKAAERRLFYARYRTMTSRKTDGVDNIARLVDKLS